MNTPSKIVLACLACLMLFPTASAQVQTAFATANVTFDTCCVGPVTYKATGGHSSLIPTMLGELEVFVAGVGVPGDVCYGLLSCPTKVTGKLAAITCVIAIAETENAALGFDTAMHSNGCPDFDPVKQQAYRTANCVEEQLWRIYYGVLPGLSLRTPC